MKDIKLFLLAISFVFTSCDTDILGDDTYSIEYVDNEAKQGLAVTLTIDRDRVASETQVGFTVSIEDALSVDAVVTVANTNKCGGPLSHLAEFTTASATIKAGDTTATGSIIASAMNSVYDGEIPWDGLSDCATFDVTGIALSEGDDPYVASTSVATTVTQLNSDYMADADDDAVMIVMDWKNPDVNDFDMYVTDMFGASFYEVAESGSRFEGDYFDNDSDTYYPAGDGQYIVWYAPYVQEAADVPAEIYFTHPVTGIVDVISFVSADGTADWPPTPVAVITKITDGDGTMSYSVKAYE